MEVSQTHWLLTNEELSVELEKALQSNILLKSEIVRLKEQIVQLQNNSNNNSSTESS